MNHNNAQKGGIVTFIIIVLAVMAGAGIYVYMYSPKHEGTDLSHDMVPSEPVRKEEPAVAPSVETAPVATEPKSKQVTTAVYKNGTYSANGVYRSPAGNETINVTLVIKDDVVVDSTVTGTSVSDKSKKYISTFINNFKVQVVGKSIDSIKLDKVSGSSLTPKGFNDALSKIKVEAKV